MDKQVVFKRIDRIIGKGAPMLTEFKSRRW